MRDAIVCRTNKLSEKVPHNCAVSHFGTCLWDNGEFSLLSPEIDVESTTPQASGRGMLERVFKLREHGTTARTEVIAGFTTFLTMVLYRFC